MLGIFGLIFAIVAPFFIYRTAKQNGRNAIFRALLTLVVGVGIQIVIPLLIGVVIALVMFAQGFSEYQIQQAVQPYTLIIGILCLVLSIVGIFLIMNQVNKVPTEESFINPPAPPTNFN